MEQIKNIDPLKTIMAIKASDQLDEEKTHLALIAFNRIAIIAKATGTDNAGHRVIKR